MPRQSFHSRWTSLMVCLVVAGLALTARGENRPALTVIASSDASGLNIGSAVQYAVAQLFRRTNQFQVQLSAYQLPGFTVQDTEEAHTSLVSRLFSFAYVEKERLSLFLFDQQKAGQYVVAATSLPKQLSTRALEDRLSEVFRTLIQKFQANEFQWLPGAQADLEVTQDNSAAKARAVEAGRLFRELSALQESPLYIGANVGTVRLQQPYGTETRASDEVLIGGFLGYRIDDSWRVEGAFDVYSHLFLRLDGRYSLPLSGKYVRLDVMLGVGMPVAELTRAHEFQALPLFRPYLGPGLGFAIPMLGTQIRGEIRMQLLGGGQLLSGTYGVSYSLNFL